MKVYKEWLCNEDNTIAYKPLSFWVEYFGLTVEGGNWFTKNHRYMAIEKRNGYGLTPAEYDEYKDKLFFVGNADLTVSKLREKLH